MQSTAQLIPFGRAKSVEEVGRGAFAHPVWGVQAHRLPVSAVE